MIRRLATALLAGISLLVAALTPRRPRAEDRAAGRSGTRTGGSRWKRWLVETAVILAVLAAGGFLVAASGVIPIKASSGHWPITQWFLTFSMHRSFATHSLGIEAPPLDDPALVLRGAGAYEGNCRPCHGSPELPHPRIAQQMLPVPLYLPPKVSEWRREELYSLVKHGVKLTGMPAWPAQQRDDEVWAMVAFLLALAELDAVEYRRLVHGDGPAAGESAPLVGLLGTGEAMSARLGARLGACTRCHGVDGRGRMRGAFPRLAGQRPAYLYASLEAYAGGKRHSGIMEPVAAGLEPAEMRALALYFSRLPAAARLPAAPSPRTAGVAGATGPAGAIERGRAIAHRGVPGRRVPSCADCHGPGAVRRNPIFPLLAGQDATYLVQQLELFKKRHRGGSRYSHLMRPVAARLSAGEMRDVALYYESLGPEIERR